MTMAKTHHCLVLKWLQGDNKRPGGSAGLKLGPWCVFSQGNGSRTSRHRAWSFLPCLPVPQLQQCWLTGSLFQMIIIL